MNLKQHQMESPAAGAELARAASNGIPVPAGDMMAQAQAASAFLKALAHEGRMMILCHLTSGEKSVTELENLLDMRQAAVSQQLARLRFEGIVTCRRDGKTIYYSLTDSRAAQLIELIHAMFCKHPNQG